MVGTLYLLAGILAVLLLVLLFVLIQRKKRNYVIPKVKNKKGVFVMKTVLMWKADILAAVTFSAAQGKRNLRLSV